jgi:hypothetical protein
MHGSLGHFTMQACGKPGTGEPCTGESPTVRRTSSRAVESAGSYMLEALRLERCGRQLNSSHQLGMGGLTITQRLPAKCSISGCSRSEVP